MNAEKAALRYLHSFPREVYTEAEELHRAGAVKEIYGHYQAFQAIVRTPDGILACSLKIDDEKWLGSIGGRDDKGAPLAAAMLEWLDRSGEIPAKPNGGDDLSLEERIEEALARKLTVKEQDYIGKIEGRFTKWRQKGEMIDHDMVRLHPRWPVETYEALELWPEGQAPQDILEFWNYLAYALAKKSLTWPPALTAVTDLNATRKKFQSWEHESDLHLWRARAARLADEGEAPAVQKVALRLQITPRDARPQACISGEDQEAARFSPLEFHALRDADDRGECAFDAGSALLWSQLREHWKYAESTDLRFDDDGNRRFVARLLQQPALRGNLVTLDEHSFQHVEQPLRWVCEEAGADEEGHRHYALQLVTAEEEKITHSLTVLPAQPPIYLGDDFLFRGPRHWGEGAEVEPRHELPPELAETSLGIDFLLRLGIALPPSLAERVVDAPMNVRVNLWLSERKFAGDTEYLFAEVTAESGDGVQSERLFGDTWAVEREALPQRGQIVRYDRAVLRLFPALTDELGLGYEPVNKRFRVKLTKAFPERFHHWASHLPQGVSATMDETLASLMEDPFKVSVEFDVRQAEGQGFIDWFDLKIVLKVEGETLTQEELRALVEARGGFVRMNDGKWRRLDMELPEGQAEAIAQLGLDVFDLSGETHRMHVLQLSSPAARGIFDPNTWNRLCDRAATLKLSVQPPPPTNLRATLRPYQVDGFHFLAYLATNRFGGILADDMGLGKTVQSLCWVLWLRDKERSAAKDGKIPPTLVVAPKSVLDVWAGECVKFAPELRVQVIRNKDELDLDIIHAGQIDVLVLNYAQLRVNHEKLKSVVWLAAILDEGQQIKNPDSLASRAARDLRAENRMVLTGTPIENRLLDIWSLMAFAMPGVLGNKAYFSERFDRRKDTNAHLRLSARLRPFLLRRTKGQVALDLPPRTEEDVLCKLEKVQEELYQAELERIQSVLLGFKSDEALRKNSFVVLQGLMRLRQICCHPSLIDSKHSDTDSAKMNALFYLLDGLRDSGHKVLVFSQFTSMLEIIRARLEREERPHFLLTGQTANRGEVVAGFQESKDPAVFLLSLKAGGSGLNLTAASYVVLYDPWWNPAVENQAIDRTHRLGQTNPVIAYRLLARNTIEEKIRVLQEQKKDLVTGVLGEESFTKNLRLDDLRFLFSREEEMEEDDEG